MMRRMASGMNVSLWQVVFAAVKLRYEARKKATAKTSRRNIISARAVVRVAPSNERSISS